MPPSASLAGRGQLCFLALTSSASLHALRSQRRSCSNWIRASCLLNASLPWTSSSGHVTTPFRKRRFHTSSPRAAPQSADPYKVLGVAKDATAAEIKKSYFQLARQYHPDSNKNPSAKDKFIEIQQAYDTLGDEKKRAAYDRYGAASQQPGFDPDAFANARGPFGAGGFGGFQDFASAFAGANGSGSGAQSELFEQLFGAFGGGSRARTQRFRGEDIQNTVHISFIEACKGVSRTINVKPIVDCNRCSGSGIKAGAKRSKCHTCGGTGTQSYIIDSGFQVSSTCTTCQGRGTFINKDAQ